VTANLLTSTPESNHAEIRIVVRDDAIRDTIERFETTGSPASLLAESEASRRGAARRDERTITFDNRNSRAA
jgi:hypothetical protein